MPTNGTNGTTGTNGAPTNPDDRKKMAAIAAVINPLSLTQDETKIFLFSAQVENKNILAYEQRVLGNTKKSDLRLWVSEDEHDVGPPKVNLPSSLVALYHDLCLHVYGILEPSNTICLLSPVYERQPAVAATGRIAGCTDGDLATIFFESEEDGKKAIVKKELPADGDGNDVIYTNDFLSGTHLGAAYDGTDYWVAYQRPNKTISVSNYGLKSIRDVSTEEKWFLSFTPIALLFVPNSQWKVDGNESARGRLVTYWLDDEETLHRSWSIVDASGGVNFSNPAKAGGKSNKATKFGQLSVLYDPKGKKNVIHCHPQAANHNASVQIYSDAWSGF